MIEFLREFDLKVVGTAPFYYMSRDYALSIFDNSN